MLSVWGRSCYVSKVQGRYFRPECLSTETQDKYLMPVQLTLDVLQLFYLYESMWQSSLKSAGGLLCVGLSEHLLWSLSDIWKPDTETRTSTCVAPIAGINYTFLHLRSTEHTYIACIRSLSSFRVLLPKDMLSLRARRPIGWGDPEKRSLFSKRLVIKIRQFGIYSHMFYNLFVGEGWIE